MKTYNFNDYQIQVLKDIKDIFAENIAQKRSISAKEIFDNPIYIRIIGSDYQELNKKFDNRLPEVFEELQTNFKV